MKMKKKKEEMKKKKVPRVWHLCSILLAKGYKLGKKDNEAGFRCLMLFFN